VNLLPAVRWGFMALKSVINSPLGAERYPTAPSSTREGDHRGKVTANETHVQLVPEQKRNDVRD
jgi:hypothetical protein